MMDLNSVEKTVSLWMGKYGIIILRFSLALVFVWFGALKFLGMSPAAELVSQTVPWLPPGVFLPVLGWWEVFIGLFMLYRPTVRIALILLFLQMPGTLSPLILLPQRCFSDFPIGLTLEGQYIVKNLILIGAAIVIGGTVRRTSSSNEVL